MASPFSGSVAEVCEALVATPSEYGDEELIAGLVEERCRELGVVHERRGNAIVARTGGPGPAMALVGHLDTVPNWPGGTTRVGGRPHHRARHRRHEGRRRRDAAAARAVRRSPAARLARVLRPRGGREPPERHPRGAGRPAPARGPDVRRRARADRQHGARRRGRDDERRRRLPRQARAQRAAVAGRERDLRGGRRAGPVRRPQGGAGGGRGPRVPRHHHGHAGARRRHPQRRSRRVPPRGQRARAHRAATWRTPGPRSRRSPCPARWSGSTCRRRPSRTSTQPARAGVHRGDRRRGASEAGLDRRRHAAGAGIPALNYGPGEASQAHQREEWVSIAALEHCEQVLADYLGR